MFALPFSFCIRLTAGLVLAACFQFPGQAEPVGIVKATGSGTAIRRGADTLQIGTDGSVEMADVIRTSRSTAKVRFLDNTELSIGEQSSVEIDRFVYDPESAGGGSGAKMALRVAIGTARFVTGQIGKAKPQDVDIKTPTATVGIRGTDFSMTVDEIGRSLVILLPTCPAGFVEIERDCKVGSIEVSTDESSVILTKAFEATLVASRESSPTAPLILNLNESQINNLLIIAPPAEVRPVEARTGGDRDNALDAGGLLANALDGPDALAADALDRDPLAVAGLLANALDDAQRQLEREVASQIAAGDVVRGLAIGSGVTAEIEGSRLTLSKPGDGAVVGITMPSTGKATIVLRRGGTETTLSVNGGGGVTTINQ